MTNITYIDLYKKYPPIITENYSQLIANEIHSPELLDALMHLTLTGDLSPLNEIASPQEISNEIKYALELKEVFKSQITAFEKGLEALTNELLWENGGEIPRISDINKARENLTFKEEIKKSVYSEEVNEAFNPIDYRKQFA